MICQRPLKWARTAALFGTLTLALSSHAEVPVTSSVRQLPVSNGHTAVLLDLDSARLTHFREHLFATEEPLLDGAGQEIWENGEPRSIATRDLLYDSYFGLRVNGQQSWLTGDPVVLADSGYAGYTSGKYGGSGVASLVQERGDLELTTFVLTPQTLPHAGYVMALRVRNKGASDAQDVRVFSLHNFHLGFGRPGVRNDIGEQGETVGYSNAGGTHNLWERGFAGVIVARGIGPVSRHAGSYATAPAAENLFEIVNAGGSGDFPDLTGQAPTQDGSITGFQFDLGNIPADGTRWAAVAVAHHGDPFADAEVQLWLNDYIAGRDAAELVNAELDGWSQFQAGLTIPPGISADDERLVRHSAVMLNMAQVKETHSYLREWLTTDGEPRYTRFGTDLDGPPANLPATVAQRANGAVLASLPPGEWTVAWIRDGAYAVAAMAALGMQQQAHDALSYYLNAEAGRFQNWSELEPYAMPAYRITLVRYYGFGVEETDFNGFGPNLEFDGFGLFLWALRRYELETGDTSLSDGRWPLIRDEVADVIVQLINPETGLLQADSSIWESHWNGRERQWAYTNITAARGLCDAAAMAERLGDADRANSYRDAGMALRQAIADRLTDADGAIAANVEELESGAGYWDAAVLDAIAMGLFDPQGRIAQATLAGLDNALATPAGAGWSRNDDRYDHAGATDLSPWGSDYDSGEWVITDLRGSVATRLAGDDARADRLSDWVRAQALANYLEVAEVFDEGNGQYKFNSPMVGFGAGAFVLAQRARQAAADPACGAYFAEEGSGGSGGSGGGGVGPTTPETDDGCGCHVPATRNAAAPAWAAVGLLLMLLARRRRHQRRRAV